MVPSESVDELSETPDHPLSATTFTLNPGRKRRFRSTAMRCSLRTLKVWSSSVRLSMGVAAGVVISIKSHKQAPYFRPMMGSCPYYVFFAARVQYLYTSRAKIYMTRISSKSGRMIPLLFFSDERKIVFESLYNFQSKDVGSVNKHHVQMGLPEGHSMLVHDAIEGKQYQVILGLNKHCPRT